MKVFRLLLSYILSTLCFVLITTSFKLLHQFQHSKTLENSFPSSYLKYERDKHLIVNKVAMQCRDISKTRPNTFMLFGSSPIFSDPYSNFTRFDKLLFSRFSASVATEMGKPVDEVPQNYADLMSLINEMTKSRPVQTVHRQGKNMLVRLFPTWLLPQYKWMFSKPFPKFSAWMNAWVTNWTTNWLMGNSKVYDLILPDGNVAKEQGLLIEKCRFLETAGCIKTCLHACKIPTQSFFLEEMGLPVTLKPNFTDLSCKFEFGVMPIPLEKDEDIINTPCLQICQEPIKAIKCIEK